MEELAQRLQQLETQVGQQRAEIEKSAGTAEATTNDDRCGKQHELQFSQLPKTPE